MEYFRQLSAFAVFSGIAGLGFIFLLVSLFFGEVFEQFGMELDHDLDHGGPGFMSPRILSVFITAFGGGGAISTSYGLTVGPSSAIGFFSGAVFATLIYYFAKFLYGQQATTQVHATDVVGRPARVTVAIPPSGVGQVRMQVGEEIIDKIARSKSGEAIPEHALVVVETVLGEIVVVRPE
jgi:membrane protein implicated in regulation of membrane protease activity